MALALFGAVLFALAAAVVVAAMLRQARLDEAAGRACLAEIRMRLATGACDEATADAERLELYRQSASLRRKLGGLQLSGTGAPHVASAYFAMLCAVIAVLSPAAGGARPIGGGSVWALDAGASLETALADFVRARHAGQDMPAPQPDEILPDVEVMIARLESRLRSAPGDVNGWRMLGWSFFHTERYQQAATAFAKALAIDPSSSELKLLHAQAVAKAANGG